MTEIKETNARSLLFYDDECSVCRSTVNRWKWVLRKRGVETVAMQSSRGRRHLGLEKGVVPDEMKLRLSSGKLVGGGDALIHLTGLFWWAKPLHTLASVCPCSDRIANGAYRWVAAGRYCVAGACRVTSSPKDHNQPSWREMILSSVGYLPLFIGAGLVASIRSKFSPWVFMWVISYTLFVGFKFLTLWLQREKLQGVPSWRILAYVFAWVGMDPRPFLVGQGRSTPRVPHSGLASSLCSLIVGALILVFAASNPAHLQDQLRAGLGLIGLACVLHFGLFKLVAWFWSNMGIAVAPVMNAPLQATSVNDFWSRRWNLAFRDLARVTVYRPVSRLAGGAVAMLLVFLVSGFLHEVALSLPARGGYGLPTLYFLLQGCAALTERYVRSQRPSMSRFAYRLSALATVVLPIPLLFHSAFLRTVIIPFLNSLQEALTMRITYPPPLGFDRSWRNGADCDSGRFAHGPEMPTVAPTLAGS